MRPARATWQTPERAEDVWIDTADGGRMHAWLFRPQDAPPGPIPGIVFLHGRADSIADYRHASPGLADAIGAALLMVDYRAHGQSSDLDCPTRRHLIEDGHAAAVYLRRRPDIDPDRVAVWGASMGGYPAVATFVDDPDLRALVLWASPADVRWLIDDNRARLGAPSWLLARLAVRTHREPRHEIRRAGDRPVLIVHPLIDRVVPLRHGQTIAAAAHDAGVPVQLMIDDQSAHARISDDAMRRITEFLRDELQTDRRAGSEPDSASARREDASGP